MGRPRAGDRAVNGPGEAALPMAPTAPPLPLPAERVARNQALNQTHSMADLRARGGWVVRWIERRRRELVAREVRARRPHTVLDLGCEDGWIAEAYAAGVQRLVLADLDPAMLAQSALAGRPGVVTVVGDALDPQPLAAQVGPQGADVIVLSALLEHLDDPSAAVAGLRPLLAPGGCFVVYVPADRPILRAKSVLRVTGLGRLVRGLSLAPAPGHVQVFDAARLRAVLAPHGTLLRLAFDPLALGYTAVLEPRARQDA